MLSHGTPSRVEMARELKDAVRFREERRAVVAGEAPTLANDGRVPRGQLAEPQLGGRTCRADTRCEISVVHCERGRR